MYLNARRWKRVRQRRAKPVRDLGRTEAHQNRMATQVLKIAIRKYVSRRQPLESVSSIRYRDQDWAGPDHGACAVLRNAVQLQKLCSSFSIDPLCGLEGKSQSHPIH